MVTLLRTGRDVLNAIGLTKNKVNLLANISDDTLEELTSSDRYSETSFTDGVLTSISTYKDSSKTTLINTKTFTYTDGRLTSIEIRNELNIRTFLQTITNTSNGAVETITKDFL